MAFDESLIKDVLNHADIVKVIGSFVPVTKKGKGYVAKCPFHDDTDPSLSISTEKRMFKCFVCGTGGSAITFVQKFLHIPFIEALKKVAEMSNFHDPRLEQTVIKPKNVDIKKETLIKCLSDLTLYYEYAVSTPEGKEGLDYFESRHLDSDLRSKYRLGYAFKNGKATIEFLQKRGHSLKTIEDTGISSLMDGSYFDKNQGRVIFPISDTEGNVIGYSARRLSNNKDEAKYINSPETYLFHKTHILYNYHIAKEKARIANCVYVCEGFMDVFALSKIGIDNCVAIMGTALTSEHIEMLRRLNVEVRLCLDGDLPGQTAMMKCAKMLEAAQIKTMIVDNHGSIKDPDEILNEDGEEALRAYLNKLMNRVDFVLAYYERTNPLKTSEEKKQLISGFLPTLLSIRNQLDFDNYLRKLSNITGYDVESLRDLVARSRNTKTQETESVTKIVMSSFHPERKILKRLCLAERQLLTLMVNDPKAVVFYEKKQIHFYDETYRALANYLIDYASTNPTFNELSIIASLESSELDNKEELLREITSLYVEKNIPKDCNEELLKNLLESIEEERERIHEEDILNRSIEGKDPLEQARIISENNRRKAKKLNQTKGDK